MKSLLGQKVKIGFRKKKLLKISKWTIFVLHFKHKQDYPMIKNEITRQGNVLFRYRSFFPFLLLPLAFYYLYRFGLSEHMSDIMEHHYFYFCFAVSFIGLAVRGFTVGCVPNNTSGRNTKQQKADVLNTTGMYSIVRHPLYLANYIMFAGFLMAFESLSFFLIGTLLFFFYYERIAAAEENFLVGKFGEPYSVWANKTPAFFPRFSGWVKANQSLSWRKILRKEGPGFLLICTYFLTFDLIEDIVFEHEAWDEVLLDDLGLISIFVIGLVTYAVLKVTRKKTDLLDISSL